MLPHNFLLTTHAYDDLKRVIGNNLEKVEDTIPKEERTAERFIKEFSKFHNINDKAALPGYAQELVKHLVPVAIRHMLVYSTKKPLGNKQFAIKFFESTKSKLRMLFLWLHLRFKLQRCMT